MPIKRNTPQARFAADLNGRFTLCGRECDRLALGDKLPEFVEGQDHPWFIAVQLHPELQSKPFAPHPLFADFVRAAVEGARLV